MKDESWQRRSLELRKGKYSDGHRSFEEVIWGGTLVAITMAMHGSGRLAVLRTSGALQIRFRHQFHDCRQRPVIKQAAKTFRGRIINALLGCAVGLTFLVLGGSREWKLPLALAVTVLLSTYVVRVQVMWRQAPITAAIVMAAGMTPTLNSCPGSGQCRTGAKATQRRNSLNILWSLTPLL
jgi:hypothetical protein